VRTEVDNLRDRVGPVLQSGPLCAAVVAAMRQLNDDVLVVDRGAYCRILVAGRCSVTRSAIEAELGRSVRFPGELETIMSSFKGDLRITSDEAVWQFVAPAS
jgi:toluene monooxygenase system protein D